MAFTGSQGSLTEESIAMQIAKSDRIRLCLTHIVTAMVSGYCVWYGLQVKGFSRIAFMILLSAGIAVPCTVALRWLSLALKRMNSALETVDTDEADTGLSEIDVATRRAIEALRQQRQLVSNVQELVARLRQTSGGGESGGTELLTDALGQLSRGTSRDIGSIMPLGDDIAKGINDTHWSAQYQLHTVKAIGQSVDALSCRFDDIGQNAKHTNQSARQVSQDAAKGIGVINQVVRGMENVRTNVDFTEKKVAGLNQLSEQISSIVETMGNISARTDMLALNASIEAVMLPSMLMCQNESNIGSRSRRGYFRPVSLIGSYERSLMAASQLKLMPLIGNCCVT